MVWDAIVVSEYKKIGTQHSESGYFENDKAKYVLFQLWNNKL